MLSFAAICPHPPLLIPSIGKEDILKVQETKTAMDLLSEDIEKKNIDTILIISPHGSIFADAMSVNLADKLSGNFYEFGDETKIEFDNDLELANEIKNLAEFNRFPLQTVASELDHGAMVPLYFLGKNNPQLKICHISFSYLTYEDHFVFGKIIYGAVQNINKRIAVIASGDLSHRLLPDAPAGYSPQGKEFDKFIISNLQNDNVGKILNIDSNLVENAGECGLRSIIILLGVISCVSYSFKKLSYEGPFGVGYLVGKFNLEEENI